MNLRIIILVLISWTLFGCAAQRAYEDGVRLIASGQDVEGIKKMEESIRLDPDNLQHKMKLASMREESVRRIIMNAKSLEASADYKTAEDAYTSALEVDPKNPVANDGINRIRLYIRLNENLNLAQRQLDQGNYAEALSTAKGILRIDKSYRPAIEIVHKIEKNKPVVTSSEPVLSASFRQKISLDLKDATIRQAFDFISKNTALNFVFDKDVKADQHTTLSLKDTAVSEVVRFIMTANQLQGKPLNPETILVYPATPAKLKEYQDLMVKTFFVGNADVKQSANLIKTVLKAKDIFTDDSLGLLVMRDTPEVVRAAERLLANQDIAEPEVVLELAVMEISRTQATQLGIQYPDKITAGISGASGAAGSVSLKELKNISSGQVSINVGDPAMTLNINDQLSKANILSNPKIRVKNREKAKILVGNKVPVVTSTTTSTGVVSESVNYLDVGLKLEVEPDVYSDNDVGIKIGLEVSNIASEIKSASGNTNYQIGTRSASTVLRLKDGETQILAGLISDEDRKSANRIPFLGSMPILGKLFGSEGDTNSKTEIVLLVTPHIVRSLAKPDGSVGEFMSGTETNFSFPTSDEQNNSSFSDAAEKKTNVENKNGNTSEPAKNVEGSSQKTRIDLNAPTQVVAGHEFRVITALKGGGGATNLVLQLTYDQNRIHVSDVKPAGEATTLGFHGAVDDELGRITISIDAKEGERLKEGDLAVITAKSVPDRAFSSEIKIDKVTLLDSDGHAIKTELSPAADTYFVK